MIKRMNGRHGTPLSKQSGNDKLISKPIQSQAPPKSAGLGLPWSSTSPLSPLPLLLFRRGSNRDSTWDTTTRKPGNLVMHDIGSTLLTRLHSINRATPPSRVPIGDVHHGPMRTALSRDHPLLEPGNSKPDLSVLAVTIFPSSPLTAKNAPRTINAPAWGMAKNPASAIRTRQRFSDPYRALAFND